MPDVAKKESSKDKPKPYIHPNAFHVYTDGSFRPPDNAACAYLIFSEKSKHIVKAEKFAYRGATINQMELRAINHALDHPGQCMIIYSDSTYCIAALTLWYKNWARNNWITPLKEPVKNKEIIQEILKKMETKSFVRFVKVKAHSGDPFNSMVDFMAAGLTAKMRDDATITEAAFPC